MDNQPEMFMCRYTSRNGNGNSGIMSHEEAIRWATTRLNTGGVERVHLMRVVSTLTRDVAPIIVIPGYVPPAAVNNNG